MSNDLARETDELVEQTLGLLRARGGRITTSRRLLLQCLFTSKEHRTAEEFAAQVKAIAPDINISTIYRNLDELHQLGIVDHVHLGHGPAIYHLASEQHGHLVCTDCGMTVEVSENQLQGFEREVKENYGFVVDSRHFALIGRCGACASRQVSSVHTH